MKRLVFLLLFSFVIAASAAATDRYASPTGTGVSPCTTNTVGGACPLNTAISVAAGNDRVILKSGTYAQAVSTVRAGTSAALPISIESETSNRADVVIQPPAGTSRGVQIRHSNVHLKNLTINCGTTNCSDNALRLQGSGTFPSETFITGNLIHNISLTQGGGVIFLGSVKDAIIRWSRFEKLSDSGKGEAFYVGANDGTLTTDNIEWYANEIINPTGEYFDFKQRTSNAHAHHNVLTGSGSLTTCAVPFYDPGTGCVNPNTGSIAYWGSAGNNRALNNIIRGNKMQSSYGCFFVGAFGGTSSTHRFGSNVCRDSVSGSLGGSDSSNPPLIVNNNTFCGLASYNKPNSAGWTQTGTNVGYNSPGAAASVCDAEEARILAEMAALPGNPATGTSPPTVSLSGSPSAIQAGQSATLTWSSTNTNFCTASGGWTGSKALSGTQSVSPTATTIYTLTCTGDGGSAAQSATINVVSATPALRLPASPTALVLGPLASALKLGPAGPGGTAPGFVTDNFARADGALGSNWAGGYSGFIDGQIVGERVRLASLGQSMIQSWVGTNIGPEQSAQVTLAGWANNFNIDGGVMLRASAPPTLTAYYVVAQNGATTTRILKIVDGSSSVATQGGAVTWQQGDRLRATAVGSTISVYRNEGATPILTFNDPSPIASGRTGIAGFVSSVGTIIDMQLDDFNAVELPAAPGGITCDRYAAPSPLGNGSGTSAANAYTIASFWPEAQGGTVKSLCLTDGVYAGSASNIDPPDGLSGTSAAPIRIAAINDGAVTIDGQALRRPVWLADNDYFVIEGFDAKNSSAEVVFLSSPSNNNIFRRICAWDAHIDGNVFVWGIHGTFNLIEDTCGFGSGRYVYGTTQTGSDNVIRRAFGMFNKTNRTDPKIVFQLGYNDLRSICENCIGTWNYEGGDFTQHYSIFNSGGTNDNVLLKNNISYYGSIGFIRESFSVFGLLGATYGSRSAYGSRFQDLVLLNHYDGVDSTHASERAILAAMYDGGANPSTLTCSPNCDNYITDITEIGWGTADSINTDSNGWTVTNKQSYATIAAMTADSANPFQSSSGNGARVCKRYVNGTITSEGLFTTDGKWPMGDRINAALTASGRDSAIYFGTGLELGGYLASALGSIPTECRQ